MGRRRSSRAEEEGDAAPPPQLPWGMEKKEMQESSLTALTDDKLARFVLGHQKKTKFQKEREDREAKKRQADEEAAKIYATFVASFDNEDETKGKAFVRGGAAQGNRHSSRDSGDVYRLKATEPAIGAGKKVSEMDKMLQEIKQKDAEHVQQSQKRKKRRAIDEFLEEMKERGPAPVPVEGVGVAKGSFDNGDPETTNLYVGNLAPTVTEEVLQAEFGRFGDVYSVKIMWPRSEEERARRRNCGFVSFYERHNADDARVNLDNKELEGQPMIVGWGKAVKIQPRARAPGLLLPSAVTPPPVTVAPVASTATVNVPEKQTVTVEVPTDGDVRRRVDHLARYVAADGLQFENAVRMREANNKADYGFLFEPQSPVGLYYRWRVYSFAMGDDEYLWREQSFKMTADGPMWTPPKMPRSDERRRGGSASRPSGRRSHHDNSPASPRRKHSSRSYSRSKSRSLSASPRRYRRGRSRSRHRSRSTSSDSSGDDRGNRKDHQRKRRSRSRSRGRRSRSWSSDDTSSRKRSRRSRSRSRSRRDTRDGRHDRSRDTRHVDDRTTRGQGFADKNEKLLTGQQIARARDMERGRERNRLSSDDYDDFKDLLDGLTLERESVKKTMGFALDNSEAAVDLVGIILESFKRSASSGVALIGLLYVTSDILHNSSAAVKNASLFRTTFQECLPEIMDTLRIAHKSIGGRMSANAMKEKVMNVLTAWESWSLFPPAVLVGLHATFLRKMEEEEYIAARSLPFEGIHETDLERLRKTCRQSGVIATGDAKTLVARLHWLKEFTSPTTIAATEHLASVIKPRLQPNSTTIVVGEPKGDANVSTETSSEQVDEQDGNGLDGEPIDEEDLDGDPIGEEATEGEQDVDGESMGEEELDGEPLDGDAAGNELDGELLDGDDLDGAPMDEGDLDGEPI